MQTAGVYPLAEITGIILPVQRSITRHERLWLAGLMSVQLQRTSTLLFPHSLLIILGHFFNVLKVHNVVLGTTFKSEEENHH